MEASDSLLQKKNKIFFVLYLTHPHHLRHTFCTRLCENETNLKVIQSVMGRKDIQTTMDVYAEATEQKKQESFERLAAKLDIF